MSDKKVPLFAAVEDLVVKRPLNTVEKSITALIAAAVVFGLMVAFAAILRELWNRSLAPLFPGTIGPVPDVWRMLGVILFVSMLGTAAFGFSRLFMAY